MPSVINYNTTVMGINENSGSSVNYYKLYFDNRMISPNLSSERAQNFACCGKIPSSAMTNDEQFKCGREKMPRLSIAGNGREALWK